METASPKLIGESEPAKAAARVVLDDCISRATRAMRSASLTDLGEERQDPLGDPGRLALMTIDDSRLDHAIGEWVDAGNGFWDAVHQVAVLTADDDLRQGRHQRMVEAGIRWRKQVLGQRRAAFVAATRTAQRALHRVPALPA